MWSLVAKLASVALGLVKSTGSGIAKIVAKNPIKTGIGVGVGTGINTGIDNLTTSDPDETPWGKYAFWSVSALIIYKMVNK